jgi:hypothetical protein
MSDQKEVDLFFERYCDALKSGITVEDFIEKHEYRTKSKYNQLFDRAVMKVIKKKKIVILKPLPSKPKPTIDPSSFDKHLEELDIKSY